MSQSFYGNRDYTFGQLMHKLRTGTRLTQTELAGYLGVSRRAVGDWEAGNNYPKSQHLKQFIVLGLEHQVFEVGREAEEIRTLWQTARQKLLLDETWLAALLLQTTSNTLSAENNKAGPIVISSRAILEKKEPKIDWSEAPTLASFYGREAEMAQLQKWVVEEGCQVTGLLGMGGIGKSALASSFMRSVVGHFEVVIWRSLHNAPDCQTLLDDCLLILSPEKLNNGSSNLERRLSLLLEQLQNRRVLLVLDNLETVLEKDLETERPGAPYQDYRRLLRRLIETTHQSCFLFTSRQKPNELIALEGNRSPVRVMRLAPLDSRACKQLLAEKNVTGSVSELSSLIEVYAGNPLALKIAGQTILDFFSGQLTPFLAQNQLIFGGIRTLLDEQFRRLSTVEQTILLWLAIMREPATLDDLLKVLITPLPRIRLLEAIESLHRHSLIERGQKHGSFTLQTVVLEFVTAWFVTEASHEIERGSFTRLAEHSLALAQVPDYVRQTQLRFLATPVFEYLSGIYSSQPLLETQLLALLQQLKSRSEYEQGYTPANLVTLLQLLRGNLRGLDLSQLWLRGVSLQGVEMQDAKLAGATIQASVFTQTFDAISSVAVSNNGEYWAASTRRGEILMWEAGGQTLLRSWQAHSERTWSLMFSPDSKTLVSGSWDGMVKLWGVANGSLLWSGHHPGNINSVAFAPDGTMLASAGSYDTIIWDVKSGTALQSLRQPELIITVRWSPQGGLVATGDVAGQIRLWRVNRAEAANCSQIIEAHSQIISEIAFAPDGATLASASYDSTIKLWNVADGQLRQTLTVHNERVHCVYWSPDGRILASGGYEKIIWLWHVAQNRYLGTLQGHTDSVLDLAFTPDSCSLISGGDTTLRVWDITSRRSINVLQGSVEALFDIDWSPDNIRLISGGSNKLVTIYNTVDGMPLGELRGHGGLVFGVQWSPDGTRLASSSWDATVRVWDANTGNNLQMLQAFHDPVTFFGGISWSPDGQRLAGATYLNALGVVVWDASDGSLLWQSLNLPAPTRRVAWSPDNKWLAGGGDNGSLYLWDAHNGTLLQQLKGHRGPIKSVAWSGDSKRLISAGGSSTGGQVVIWDIFQGEQLHTIGTQPGIVYAAVWNEQNDVVITGGSDGKLRWWNVANGNVLAVYEAHRGTIQALKLSPDGTKLASCGDDGAILLWDLLKPRYLKTIRRDRLYERLNITDIKGLTEAQKLALHTLGARED